MKVEVLAKLTINVDEKDMDKEFYSKDSKNGFKETKQQIESKLKEDFDTVKLLDLEVN